MKKIVHQRKKCIGCSSCAMVCQEFFIMDKDGSATLKNSREVGGNFELVVENTKCAKDAAFMCPVKIIKIEEVDQ